MEYASDRDTLEDAQRASAVVAPLVIKKDHSRTHSSASRYTHKSSDKFSRTPSLKSQTQISPPLTPRTSRDNIGYSINDECQFHNYIRAFYHFHPTSTITSSGHESSITVPINEGDVILVHSIHPNGWADGTLIADGSRGWLPTNYCEVYQPPEMQKLLTSLTHLWDMVRIGENGDLTAFTRQDSVKAMIAGVKFLLGESQCLTRDSPLVKAHAGLRRFRKGLLGNLSALVKTAKKLQDLLLDGVSDNTIYDMLDDLVFKALSLVARAVRFLDSWINDAVGFLEPSPESLQRPLTPPKEIFPEQAIPTGYDNQETRPFSPVDVVSHSEPAQQSDPFGSVGMARPAIPAGVQPIAPSPSSSAETTVAASPRLSSIALKRSSASHRVSYNGKAPGARNQNLASERLCVAHDSFLGFIGSFIGLHLHSRSLSELLQTIRKSVVVCEQFLSVVEAVWERDGRRCQSLGTSKATMHLRLEEFVRATQELFSLSGDQDGEEILIPDGGSKRVDAATSCVRAAGECITASKAVLQKIGDFESETPTIGLADSILKTLETSDTHSRNPSNDETQKASTEKPLPEPPAPSPKHIPTPLTVTESKPLPEPPLLSPATLENNARVEIVESPVALSFRTSRSSIPPITQLLIPEIPQPEAISPTDTAVSQSPVNPQRFFAKPFRAGSVNASFTDTNSTYPNSSRGDSGSIISHVSTRATTPDQQILRSVEPRPMASFESFSEVGSGAYEECSNVEAKLLETTYVDELVYNKEGQISGGSLPALVEQLTLHDSTPDPNFVNTFYLTFRLFTTPTDFTNCLIDRFDYVGNSNEVGLPVRLRVFNIFKGWMESHWHHESDSEALHPILLFAMNKLSGSLPPAGKRLAELTHKVEEFHMENSGLQLISSVGKTSTSSTVYSATEKDAPNPIINKSQLSTLRNALGGSTFGSILDFDPLELARQFTIIESKTYCAIQPEELLSSKWTKNNGEKAPNVRAMSTLSTDLANLVADSILSLEDPKKRASTIKQWVKISMKCLELNNYDSLMAIICSLNSSMVLRLKRTWELVSPKNKNRLDELKKIVDVGRNYAVLRQRLQNHTAPCIPFVGIYLTDLTFVDVGNQTTRQLPGDGNQDGVPVINFDKHMRTAKIIGQLQRFQVPYNLTPIPEMQDWLNSQIRRVRSSDQANVQSYYRRSLLLEPRQPNITKTISHEGPTVSPVGNEKKFDFMGAFHFTTSAAKEKAT